jgi:hypothetical protein
MEIATQQRKLMEEMGMDIKDVAALYYGASRGSDGVERVQALAKLFQLPAATRKKVDSRELPMQAAIELVGLSEKEQTEILDTAERMASTGRIKGESVRKAVKKKKRDAGDKIGLTRADIMEFIVGLTGPGEEKPVKTLAAKLEAYFNGELSYMAAYKAFTSMGGLLEAKTPPKEEPDDKADKDDKTDPKPKAKAKKPKAKKGKKAETRDKIKSAPSLEASPEPEPEPVEAEAF